MRASFPSAGFWMGLVILTMTIREVTLWHVGAANGRIGDMLLFLVFALWFGGRCLIGRFAIVRNRLDLAVVIFLLFYVMSILWADNVEAGWYRLLKLLRNGGLYILLVDYLSANFSTRYRRIAICFVITGLLQSLAYVYSIAGEGGLAALGILLQAQAIESSNSVLDVVRRETGAGIFLQGAATWLPLCMFVGFGIQPWIRSRLLGTGNWILISGMGALTLLSASRTAWVGFAVGATVVFCLIVTRITVRQAIGGGIIFLSLIFGTWYSGLHKIVQGRLSYEVLAKDESVSIRLEFFEYALARFRESPLLGAGVASIDPEELFIVHNAYLQVLGELGIVGGGIFLWIMALWVLYLMSARRLASKRRDAWTYRVTISLLGFSAFLFISFLAGHDLGGAEPWIMMGLASALHNSGSRASSRSGI